MSRVVLRPFKATATSEIDWPELLGRLLPDELPRRHETCKAVLRSIFRRDLPEGVLQAVSSLVALELESEARALLIDFFRERRGTVRIGKRLEMQWIFQKRRRAMAETLSQESPSSAPDQARFVSEPEEQGGETDFEWAADTVEAMPTSDDEGLRVLAGEAQAQVSETAAEYRASYESETIPGWDDPSDWVAVDVPAAISQKSNTAQELPDHETRLLYRLAALGNDGLALLRYFHDNPGDAAKHAAYILDYEIADVNKQLNNKLGGYVRRHESGGWECVAWVARMLELMPK